MRIFTMRWVSQRQLSRSFLILLLGFGSVAQAEIEGVQPAALDQPRGAVMVRREGSNQALSAKVDGEVIDEIDAFLDTGASGVMLSENTAKQLGVKREQNVTYEDVGVAGADEFEVSEKLVATIRGAGDVKLRCQIGPKGGLLNELLMADVDVAGMPVLKGKVLIIDPKPLNKFDDRLKARVVMPNDPSIPATTQHVKLTMVSFKRFTRVTPVGSDGPMVVENPMIANVQISYGGKSATGMFLLDTGSACTMISKKLAEKVGVKYSEGSGNHLDGVAANAKATPQPQGRQNAKSQKVSTDSQFTLTVGGIGGQHQAAGFWLDRLELPTLEGKPVDYKKAPVLVSDISLRDPKTNETMTLDGVFGMNMLVASAYVQEGLLPDLDKLTQSPFEVIVIDLSKGLLGVK